MLAQSAIPVVVFLVGLGLARVNGFAMNIPAQFYQLLDMHALAGHPVAALCYLHTQPPGLNLLLEIVLAVARLVGATPAAIAGGFFVACGLVGAVLLWRTLLAVTESVLLSTLGLVASLANPGFYVFEHLFFYEFLLHTALILLLAATAGYLGHGGGRRLYTIALLLAAIALTRTLYHPLWACGTFVLVVTLRAGLDDRLAGIRHAVGAGALLLGLLCLWPIKNWIVFGRPFYSSTTPYNLARLVPGCPPAITSPPLLGPVASPAVAAVVARAERVCGPDAAELLTSPAKGDGSPNWNHAMLLVVAPERTRCGLAWRREHPVDWLARAAGLYALWTRPTFVHPYSSDQIIGPLNDHYRRYALAYDRTLFFDFRPAFERLHPDWFLHGQAMVRGQKVPYTLLGFVVFPAVASITVVLLLTRRWRHREALALMALLCWLWPMVAACLSDGWEGNRMRFSTGPAFLIMAGYVAWSALAPRRRDRQRGPCVT